VRRTHKRERQVDEDSGWSSLFEEFQMQFFPVNPLIFSAFITDSI
jgi:hypothetical protein